MKQVALCLIIVSCTVICISCSSDKNKIAPVSEPISFGNAVEVTINGLTFDAMEPFISTDGNYLFFNNLNDGINTRIHYAERVNDTFFNYIGELEGVNQQIAPNLDAVPNMDASEIFYWTSTRNYPAQLDNLFTGFFDNGEVKDAGRVQGDFYRNIPGWLVMDHGVSADGDYLYVNNARFDDANCVGPCETELIIARKNNNSTFSTLPESADILQNVNNPDYIYYAPHISSDLLELYFTRYPKGLITPDTRVEICVASRSSSSEEFSVPAVLFSDIASKIVEAPTLTLDKNIMYYHQKVDDTHVIMMRYRIRE